MDFASEQIAYSAPSDSESVTPQTRPLGGQSEAATYTGQNRAVEQAGPSGRRWATKSQSDLHSSDWRSLGRCFESLTEPGDEASSFPTAQEALPQAPAPAEVPHPAPNPEERVTLLRQIDTWICERCRVLNERGKGRLSAIIPELRALYSSSSNWIMIDVLEISSDTGPESLRETLSNLERNPTILDSTIRDLMKK